MMVVVVVVVVNLDKTGLELKVWVQNPRILESTHLLRLEICTSRFTKRCHESARQGLQSAAPATKSALQGSQSSAHVTKSTTLSLYVSTQQQTKRLQARA